MRGFVGLWGKWMQMLLYYLGEFYPIQIVFINKSLIQPE